MHAHLLRRRRPTVHLRARRRVSRRRTARQTSRNRRIQFPRAHSRRVSHRPCRANPAARTPTRRGEFFVRGYRGKMTNNARTHAGTNERTNERVPTFVGTNESTSERGVKKPALDVSACDGARAGSIERGGCAFRAEVCRAEGLGEERNESACAPSTQNDNHPPRVSIRRVTRGWSSYIQKSKKRKVSIMMTRQGFCIYGKLLVSMRYLCTLFISSHVVCTSRRVVVSFVYLPNPEPSDISIWCTLW